MFKETLVHINIEKLVHIETKYKINLKFNIGTLFHI